MLDIITELESLAQSVEWSGGGQYREYQIAMRAIREIENLREQVPWTIYDLWDWLRRC